MIIAFKHQVLCLSEVFDLLFCGIDLLHWWSGCRDIRVSTYYGIILSELFGVFALFGGEGEDVIFVISLLCGSIYTIIINSASLGLYEVQKGTYSIAEVFLPTGCCCGRDTGGRRCERRVTSSLAAMISASCLLLKCKAGKALLPGKDLQLKNEVFCLEKGESWKASCEWSQARRLRESTWWPQVEMFRRHYPPRKFARCCSKKKLVYYCEQVCYVSPTWVGRLTVLPARAPHCFIEGKLAV